MNHQQSHSYLIKISPIDSLVGKVDYYEVCANIDIWATQALFAMKFSLYTVKMTYTIIFDLFSILFQFGKICLQISIKVLLPYTKPVVTGEIVKIIAKFNNDNNNNKKS